MNSRARPNASQAEGLAKVVEIDRASEAKSKCEPLIGADQAAKLLEVHPKTVKRLAAEGIIPGMRLGRLWRFRASVLDAWARSQLHLSRHPCTDTKGEE